MFAEDRSCTLCLLSLVCYTSNGRGCAVAIPMLDNNQRREKHLNLILKFDNSVMRICTICTDLFCVLIVCGVYFIVVHTV